ncbi:unnamed protein product [Protopolystoma xenopodis]|uniref:Uncharacterized protein n=1 Tax=Protopolystoma xenopodis TaxID=117903 RepID=A0A3S5A648_9PLAT|nr:unnamed protein product [Protopolystoma xenopodis]
MLDQDHQRSSDFRHKTLIHPLDGLSQTWNCFEQITAPSSQSTNYGEALLTSRQFDAPRNVHNEAVIFSTGLQEISADLISEPSGQLNSLKQPTALCQSGIRSQIDSAFGTDKTHEPLNSRRHAFI